MDKRRHDIERAGKKAENTERRKYFRKIAVLGDPVHGRNKRCVWTITTKPYSEAHFATYPPELCEIPVKAGCPRNGIVLDPFMGSGTTGMIAKKLGRKFLGIEPNPKYIRMAKGRIVRFRKNGSATAGFRDRGLIWTSSRSPGIRILIKSFFNEIFRNRFSI